MKRKIIFFVVIMGSLYNIENYPKFFKPKYRYLFQKQLLNIRSARPGEGALKINGPALENSCRDKDIQIFFPSADKNILDIFMKLINDEKKSILFAAYTLTHPDVVEGLKNAAKRGVQLRGVVDCNTVENFTQRGWSNDTVVKQQKIIEKFLKEYDIPMYDRNKQCMHNKLFLFEKNGITGDLKFLAGSANPSKSGLNATCDKEKNEEYSHNPETVIVVTNRLDLWQKCKKEIEYLMSKAREK